VVLKAVAVVTKPVKVIFPVVLVRVIVGTVVAPLTVSPPLFVTVKALVFREEIVSTPVPFTVKV
jgi:hypothetical protein